MARWSGLGQRLRIPLFPWGRDDLVPLRRLVRSVVYWAAVSVVSAALVLSIYLRATSDSSSQSDAALAVLEVAFVLLAAGLFAILGIQSVQEAVLRPGVKVHEARSSLWLALILAIVGAAVVGFIGYVF